MAQAPLVGVDVGGTFLKAGVVAGGRVVRPDQAKTPHDFGEFVDALAALVTSVTLRTTPEAVGLGVPGIMDRERGCVVDAPNLAFLEQEPLVAAVQERVGAPVTLENDGNLAALGEARHGAGRGHPDFLLCTLGTGVGGGLILDGRLYAGPGGKAGEFGHLPVGGERICGCGARGCLETVVSANGMVQTANEEGIPVAGLPDLAGMARRNHEGARSVFQRAGVALGECFAQVALLLDLRVFLVGGGGAPVLDLLRGAALRTLSMRAFGRAADEFVIKEAALGNEAGILGAAVHAAETGPRPAAR